MASMVIHLCVAKKINEKLKVDENDLFLGAIAPDISKCLGESKVVSHFQKTNDNIPILSDFLSKYKLNNNFLLGYYIHLYTDYIWFKYFLTNIASNNNIKLLDGTIIDYNQEKFVELIYNDYTNLNIQLLTKDDIDDKLFYKTVTIPNVKMDEIPVDKLQVLIDKGRKILESATTPKDYVFDIKDIDHFIDVSSNIIYQEIIKIRSQVWV